MDRCAVEPTAISAGISHSRSVQTARSGGDEPEVACVEVGEGEPDQRHLDRSDVDDVLPGGEAGADEAELVLAVGEVSVDAAAALEGEGVGGRIGGAECSADAPSAQGVTTSKSLTSSLLSSKPSRVTCVTSL
jgi:hypothetical protein